jgi:hypothetical protein
MIIKKGPLGSKTIYYSTSPKENTSKDQKSQIIP